jgi:TetR/AcrR family transcriptional regulator, tetracycline repressor protein
MALSADKIVQSALRLLNEIGLDKLSTRRLASELNVQGPAIYRHFESKADLLDQMATTMLSAGFSNLEVDEDWKSWLRSMAGRIRNAVLTYRDGARLLIASSPSAPRRSKLADAASLPLVNAGFDIASARLAAVTVFNCVLGWSLNEGNPATRRMMIRDFGDIEKAFEEAVEIVIVGVERRRLERDFASGARGSGR